MIPRLLHLFWVGSPVPEWANENVARWRRLMPDWDVHLWSNEPGLGDAAGLAFATASHVIPADHVRHGANIVRAWLMWTYGGVWADCDVTPLLPLDPLCGGPFVADYAGAVVPCLMGAEPADMAFLDVLDSVRSRRGTSPQVTGCWPLTAAIDRRSGWSRLPAGRFLSRDSLGRPVPLPPDGIRYTTHDYRTSASRNRLSLPYRRTVR